MSSSEDSTNGRTVSSVMGGSNGSPAASAGISSMQSSMHARGLAAAILYGGMAVAMNFVNKYTMQVFPLPNVVMALQMAAAWLILQPLQSAGVLQFPPFSFSTARRLIWITAAYTANTVFSLMGLLTLNIPMYNTLKRLTPVMVLGTKAILFRKAPPQQITLSVCLLVVGCLVAGAGDLGFDLTGYACALASCASQAAYLLLVELQGASGVSTSELLYYNAVSSLPLLVVVSMAMGEAGRMADVYLEAVQRHGALSVPGTVLMCSLMGVLLNYTLFLCTTTNSALTTTIVGVLKSVLAILLGFFLLGGVKFHWMNVTGIALSTLGGTWYSAIKYHERRNPG